MTRINHPAMDERKRRAGFHAPRNSGVAFADFNGDGRMDLYVGKCGSLRGRDQRAVLVQRGDGRSSTSRRRTVHRSRSARRTTSPPRPDRRRSRHRGRESLPNERDVRRELRLLPDQQRIGRVHADVPEPVRHRLAQRSVGSIDKVGSPEIRSATRARTGSRTTPASRDCRAPDADLRQPVRSARAEPPGQGDPRLLRHGWGTSSRIRTRAKFCSSTYGNNSLTPPQLWRRTAGSIRIVKPSRRSRRSDWQDETPRTCTS